MRPAPPVTLRVLALGLFGLLALSGLIWLDLSLNGVLAPDGGPDDGEVQGLQPLASIDQLDAVDLEMEHPREVHGGAAAVGRPSTKQIVSGVLADADSGLSLADHTVILSWHPTDDAPTKVKTRTDAGGLFRFELQPPWWKMGRYYNAQVLDPVGREVFRGLLLLASEVSLVVERRPRLQGRLETQPPIDYDGVLLRVWTPPAQALETELLCGETHLGPDGSFSVENEETEASCGLVLVFAV
jgi:hypothetical protein